MKRLLMTVFAITMFISLQAQKITDNKVPAVVTKAFKAKFPTATKAKWELEDSKDYEVNFKINKAEHSAVFDASGIWMETETEIDVSQLPSAVSQAISKQFSGYKIKEPEMVEKKDKGKYYEVELTKGKETIEVVLSPKGEVISKKIESKKDKEDKD